MQILKILCIFTVLMRQKAVCHCLALRPISPVGCMNGVEISLAAIFKAANDSQPCDDLAKWTSAISLSLCVYMGCGLHVQFGSQRTALQCQGYVCFPDRLCQGLPLLVGS